MSVYKQLESDINRYVEAWNKLSSRSSQFDKELHQYFQELLMITNDAFKISLKMAQTNRDLANISDERYKEIMREVESLKKLDPHL